MQRFIYVVILFLISSAALAFEPAPIRVGDSELTPQVQLDYFSNDNVYAARVDKTESTGFIIKPSLKWEADKGLSFIALEYSGDYASYNDVDNLDYDDHTFELDTRMEFSSRSKLWIEGALISHHEDTGFGLSTIYNPAAEFVLRYKRSDLNSLYHYGADTAKGGIELGLGIGSLDYSGNDAATDGYNYDSKRASATFLYAISGATRLTTGLDFESFDYDVRTSFATLDNNHLFAFLGSRWEITGKSGGSLKFGYGKRNFKAASRDDDSTFQIQLAAYWLPLEHSRIELGAVREFVVEVASPSLKDRFQLSWDYVWSSSVSNIASVVYTNLDSDFDPDDQKSILLTLGADVSFSRWVALTFSAQQYDRTSSNEGWEFDRQTYTIGLKLSL